MATISALNRMKNAGIFRDLPATGDPVEFRQYNLIYGFNGSGKTTLSRLLETISGAGPSENLPEGIEFHFTMSNGDVRGGPKSTGQPLQHLFVFSEDFVARSLKWDEAKASPVVYIGQEQTDLAARLGSLEEKRPKVDAKVTEFSAEWSAADKTEKKHCTDVARHLSEQLGIVRGYDARTLKADYDRGGFSEEDKLPDNTRNELRKAIFESKPPESLDIPDFNVAVIEQLQVAQRVCSIRLEEVTLASLERRKDALPWIQEGLPLHSEEHECLFCGNKLTSERVSLLKQALSSGYDKLSQNLKAASDNLVHSRQKLGQKLRIVEGLPSLHISVETSAKALRAEIGQELGQLLKVLNSASEAIAAKQANPTTRSSFTVPSDLGNHLDKFQDLSRRLQQLFHDHNAIAENHTQAVEAQKEKLKRHILAETHPEYVNLSKLAAESKDRLDAAEVQLKEIDAEIRNKKNEISEHGPAAERMNQLIASYLGHDRITIELLGEGYSICRDGNAINKPLSEGEKTAIAFCYFLVLLEGEGRKLEDLIIVIDDPISSLDTRAMSHVVSLIKFSLGSCAQIFILTHNIDFLWEMKKWLNRRRLDGEAAFLFVNTKVRTDGSRESNFQELPAIIREYESEYHYLYSLAHKAASEEGGIENYMYLLPNALRKLLETYLAFKRPGFSDLGGLQSLLESDEKIDKTRVRALEALAQSESHSQSIGQTVTFSQYTLEQIVDASKAFLHLVELTDPLHFERMEKLAKKAPGLTP